MVTINKKKPHEIIDFDVQETSLVDKGANYKSFYLKKQDGNMSIVDDFKIENEEKIDKNLEDFKKAAEAKGKKLSDPTMKTMKAILGLMETVKGDMPEGVSISINNDDYTASAHIRKDEEVETPAEDAKSDDGSSPTEDAKSDDVKTDGEGEAPAEGESTEEDDKTEKSEGENMTISKEAKEAIDKAEKANEVLTKTNEKLTSRIDKLEDKNLTNEYLTIAKEKYPLIGKVEETANILKNASKTMSKEDFETLKKTFKANQEQLESSGLFKEVGSNSVDENGDVEAEIQKKAEEIRKADPSISIEKARVKVLDENPELYV